MEVGVRLTVGDTEYTIKEATLAVWVANPEQSKESKLIWNLEVEAEGWVGFYCEGLHHPNVQQWPQIVGRVVSWDDPINSDSGEMNGSWYRNAHHEILQATIQFLEREGNRIKLRWEGICSTAPLGCEPRPEERLPFIIDCWCVVQES